MYRFPVLFSRFDPLLARSFAWRVLELKEQGVSEDDVMAVAARLLKR
jgi:small subunit ribosomal protein S23